MFIFASNLGSRFGEIKRESGEIISIKSRTVPATVSYKASCKTSRHCHALRDGKTNMKTQVRRPAKFKHISQTFGIKVGV